MIIEETQCGTYSRDAVITAVRDYYHFLCAMYMDESNIMEPPADGWPSIGHWEGFDKTDEVISLLRHLPYLRHGSWPEDTMVAPECSFVDWQGFPEHYTNDLIKECTEPGSHMGPVPPHVVGLTISGREDARFLLDTEQGVVCWTNCPDEIRHQKNWNTQVLEESDEAEEANQSDDAESNASDGSDGSGNSHASFGSEDGSVTDGGDESSEADEEDEPWRQEGACWVVQDFFEILKTQFRELNFVPFGTFQVTDIWYVMRLPQSTELVALIQNTFREQGWPDLARFSKAECHRALRSKIEGRYPDDDEWEMLRLYLDDAVANASAQ